MKHARRFAWLVMLIADVGLLAWGAMGARRVPNIDGHLLSPVSSLPSKIANLLQLGTRRSIDLAESATRELNMEQPKSSPSTTRSITSSHGHGRDKKIDPSRPITSWRSAWRSLRKAAGLDHVRFHDGRHTALTRLAEKGQPDWVIQAQMGHVSPAMMRTYIRRKALDEAAAALEPSFKMKFPRRAHGLKPALCVDKAKERTHDTCDRVMSQFTSQWDDLKKEIRENACEISRLG